MIPSTLLYLFASILPVLGLPEPDAGESHAERGYYGNTIHVRKHHSIQKAIDKASRGTRIVVEAGTYAEQITIRTDGITLIGKGAILTPPEHPVKNPCSGFAGPDSQAGICIAGKGIKTSDFKVEHKKVLSVRKPVCDVSVTGFQVQGFKGFNILVIGADNAYVHHNKLKDGGAYGFLTAGSTNTHVSANEITSAQTSFIGLCMDNFSRVKVTENKIDNYYIGLCIQTNGAEVVDNEVSHACFGAFVDPGVKGVYLGGNKMTSAIEKCGALGASGILLDGSIKARVEHNFVSGWKSDGPASGIGIVDDPCNSPIPSLACLALGKPAIATGNVVVGNILKNNALDIYKNTTGRGNDVQWNKCSTSVPKRLCGRH